MQGTESRICLSALEDWKQYHSGSGDRLRDLPTYLLDVLEAVVWCHLPGKVFELGCGGSYFLYESAARGWTVSGIDYHKESVLALTNLLVSSSSSIGDGIIYDDLLEYDVDRLKYKYDLLISFGLFEHFADPTYVLKRWLAILKRDGRVITFVPNLLSINGRLLKKYDPYVLMQHIPLSTYELDRVHSEAGLRRIAPAVYFGGFDLDMLIPWDALRMRYPLQLVRIFRYTGTCLSFLFRHLAKGNRMLNPLLYGVYGNC